MTEKEVIAKFAELRECSVSEAKETINAYIELVVDAAMTDGKCAFGKIGTFKRADVKATPARTGVKNALTGGTYDVPAKPARTKLAFGLSKSGKLIGA